jgi:flagellar basal body-associated protein FliL
MIDKHITHPHDLKNRKLQAAKSTDRALLFVYLGLFMVIYFVASSLITLLFSR